MEMKTKVRKLISGILSVTFLSTTLTCFPVTAEDTDKYPYTMFAGSSEEGAITINASNVCINGSIATNGTIVSSGNMNVNGTKTENATEEMMYIWDKIDSTYFSSSNVDTYTEDYSYEETNINISNPLEVEGDLELTGNINLSTGIKALEDVNLNGDVKNTNESVICSETGDIIINTNNVNLNGLVYAPEGCVDITAQNLNMNNVIIIADTIKVECPNLNANYNSSMGEFIGTESEVELFLSDFGEYMPESNSIEIYWDTTVPAGIFDIQISYDNETYTSVGTVTDAESYSYVLSEEFEKMYIKVTQTTYYGETYEAVPFAVIKSEDGYTMDYLDSDEDGLPDIFEIEIGTKVELPDSDEDGLTDYQELYFTDTDPTIYDSVTAGIRDADIDLDSDGLSNVFELENEIDPLLEDTDDDCISDYDEIYVYGTKPDIPDSDEDKVDDGAEIKLGLDLNNPETFGYPDAEHSIEQQIEADSPVMTEVNTVENAYELSLEMKTNGYAEDVISISESGYASSIENEAMLGISTDIEINNSCNPENIVLKYTIKDEYLKNTLGTYGDCEEFQGIKRLNIFKYFEELNMLLPIETQFDEANNLIYAETDELGTYCVMDMEIWLDSLGVTPAEEIEEEINLSDIQLEYNVPTVISDESTEDIVDVVFVLQANGNKEDVFNIQKEAILCFGKLAFKTTTDISIRILHTLSSNQYIDSGWIKDFGTLKSTINDIKYIDNGEGRTNTGLGNAYYAAIYEVDYHQNSKKYPIWVWNTLHEDSDVLTPFEAELSSDFQELGIGNGIDYDGYGKGLFIYNNYDYVYFKILDAQNLGNALYTYILPNAVEKTTFEVLVCTRWKSVQLDGELNATNGINSDNDSLTDWQEVNTSLLKWSDDGSFELPTFAEVIPIADYICALNAFERWVGTPYENSLDYIWNNKVLPINSDPADSDSDDDNFPDGYISTLSTKMYYPYDDPNPLMSDVTEISLKNDFFSVDYEYENGEFDWSEKRNDGRVESYGGYQSWFGLYGVNGDEKNFFNNTRSGYEIAKYGCGMIAIADTLLYMAISDVKYNPTRITEDIAIINVGGKYEHINFSTYRAWVMSLSDFFVMPPIFNAVPATFTIGSIEKSLNFLNETYDMGLNINWGWSDNSDKFITRTKNMLENDIPVLFSIYNPNGLQLYRLKNHVYTTDDGNNAYDEKIENIVESHYMVITGIVEYSDDVKDLIGRKRMLKIATYGKEYYIDYDEYNESLSVFTNLLYITK